MSEPPRSFVIGLEPTGDDGSAYRIQNKPGEIQRKHIVDRGSGSALTVQADLVKVIHGHLSPDEDPATLIVAEFRFNCSDNSRRFREAKIELLFSDANDPKADGPEVLKITPFGKYSMNATKEDCNSTSSVNLSGSVGSGGPATIGAGVGYEFSRSFQKQFHGSVTGIMRIEGRNYGTKNMARWSLLENPSLHDGVPTFLRSAILIRRDNDDRFVASIKILAEVNTLYTLKSTFQSLLGKIPKDDPVVFDPMIDTGSLPDGMAKSNLGACDLVEFMTTEYSTRLEV